MDPEELEDDLIPQDDEVQEDPPQEDPWSFLEGQDPTAIQETLSSIENINEMRRSATEKYEEAARLRREAEELRSNPQPSYNPPPTQSSMPNFEDDFDGSKRYAALESRMAEMQDKFTQQQNELAFRHESTRAEQEIRRALRDPANQAAVEHFGEDELIRRYQNRAFSEGNVMPHQVYDKAKEWVSDDQSYAKAQEQRVIQRYLASKNQSSNANIPSSSGPKRPNRAKPASVTASKKPEDVWKKGGLSEEQELALMQAILDESRD